MPTINEPVYNDKLENALEMLAAGISLDEILANANSDAEWLGPMLETAAEVAELQQAIPIPPPDASLQRLLAYGEELAVASQPAPSATGWSLSGFMGVALALLLVVVLLGGLNFASQNSLPGEPLFYIKTANETLQLKLPWNFDRQAQLLERFNKRRQDEAKMLLDQGQSARVAFSGVVTSWADTMMVVDEFTVQITPETETRGKVTTGARIHLNGLTQPPDKLIALTITVIEPGVPALETPTPTYTPTPTVNPISEPQSLPTAMPTSIMVDSPTSPATPTLSPTPSPTVATTKTTPANQTADDNTSDVNIDNSTPDTKDDTIDDDSIDSYDEDSANNSNDLNNDNNDLSNDGADLDNNDQAVDDGGGGDDFDNNSNDGSNDDVDNNSDDSSSDDVDNNSNDDGSDDVDNNSNDGGGDDFDNSDDGDNVNDSNDDGIDDFHNDDNNQNQDNVSGDDNDNPDNNNDNDNNDNDNDNS